MFVDALFIAGYMILFCMEFMLFDSSMELPTGGSYLIFVPIPQGKVVVIRGEGPKGGPGMPEMLTPTSAIMGAGLGKVCLPLIWLRFRYRS